MPEKVLAGIITHNPDLAELNTNIQAVINQVEKILLVDNGSENIAGIQKTISDNPKIQLITNQQNTGIAAALNQALAHGANQGYTWVLTLDQDSHCQPNLLEQLQSAVQEKTAIVAPRIVYTNNPATNQPHTGIEEADWVISSASLTNTKIWQELGGFDEALFIDGVDRDYCTRAKTAGYKILRTHETALEHTLGNLKCKRILGKTIYVTHHAPGRKYYMARNVIYLDHKLGQHRAPLYISKLTFKTLVYENQKMKKMKKIIRGISDGLAMKRAA